MAKAREVFMCTLCGAVHDTYNGKCFECGNWNCLESYTQPSSGSGKSRSKSKSAQPLHISEIDMEREVRYETGEGELDRVLGGGIVRGSLVLLSGDPGVGKSTLSLQIADYLTEDIPVLYITGEESARQIKLRAQRLNLSGANLHIACLTDMDVINSTIREQEPGLVIIDSIQTMVIPDISSLPGSLVQVRECTYALSGVARELEIPVIIIGHMNKDGNIAGPKVLEHIVDAVLYLEGENKNSFRILRAAKNRYGSTNEIGVFEMRETGLCGVDNPSQILLEGKPGSVSGTCAACVMEGTRPIFAEVQALVTTTGFGTPRRTCAGFDYNRMSLLLAVLEKRVGYFFGTMDVYVNVVGGLRLDEPAADLAVIMALVSSLQDKAVGEGVLSMGEIGLTGEIRGVSGIAARVKEAERLGFQKCIVPRTALSELGDISSYSLDILGVSNVRQAFEALSK